MTQHIDSPTTQACSKSEEPGKGQSCDLSGLTVPPPLVSASAISPAAFPFLASLIEEALKDIQDGGAFELNSDVALEHRPGLLEVNWSQPDMRDPRNHWRVSRLLERFDLVRLGRYSILNFEIPVDDSRDDVAGKLAIVLEVFLNADGDPERANFPLRSKAFERLMEHGRLKDAENCCGRRVVISSTKSAPGLKIENCDSIEVAASVEP